MTQEVQKEGAEVPPTESLEEQITANVEAIASYRKKAEEDAEATTIAGEKAESVAADAERDAKVVVVQKQQASDAAAEIATLLATIQSETKEITTLLERAKADRNATANLANKAVAIETSLSEYETNLKELTTDYKTSIQTSTSVYEDLREKIEGLLPGATSVGLASSFEKRKKDYTRLEHVWATVFGICILGLIVLAFFSAGGLVHFGQMDSWSKFGLYIVKRLPIAGPLIWLAFYAGKHHWLASRLEEEYAYKEAISRSFEGYKRQMSDVRINGNGVPPLGTLCENVLRALAEQPGKIYERKHSHITPLQAATEAGKDFITPGEKERKQA